MNRKKKFFTLAAVLSAVSLLFCACGKKSVSEKELTKVTLNEVAHSIFYAPQYAAIENGYFAEEGIDLVLVNGFGVILLIQDAKCHDF